MEYEIVRLTWKADQYGVMVKYPDTGWIYVCKYMAKEDAEELYNSLTQ